MSEKLAEIHALFLTVMHMATRGGDSNLRKTAQAGVNLANYAAKLEQHVAVHHALQDFRNPN